MLYYDKQDAGWRIAVWHVTETIGELYALLPDDETVRQEAERQFKSPARILEWVAVRVLLCHMLGRQVPILYHDNGAPYLPDYEELDISISHTKGFVAVALAEQGQIGIDIEQVPDAGSGQAKVERVRGKFIRDDEQADTLTALLLHWSAKETAFKILHRERVDFRKHLRVLPFEEHSEGCFTLCESRTDEEHRMTMHYKIFPHFVLTYAFLSEE